MRVVVVYFGVVVGEYGRVEVRVVANAATEHRFGNSNHSLRQYAD